MAWSTPTTVNDYFYAVEAGVTLADSDTTYSSEIDFLQREIIRDAEYMVVTFLASDTLGANADFDLYGAWESGGTKVLLVDDIISDGKATTDTAGAVQIRKYPMPYYYIGITTGASDSAYTMTIRITI